MTDNDKYSDKIDVAIVGAGPAGLSAGIAIKKLNPQLSVCIIEKSSVLGGHCLSGAALERKAVEKLMAIAFEEEYDLSEIELFSNVIEDDAMLFLPDSKHSISMKLPLKAARLLGLCVGNMQHSGDFIVSVSQLVRWLAELAQQHGVEIYNGLAVDDVEYDSDTQISNAIIIKEQGLDKDGNKLPNYVPAQRIQADYIVLAEGCDGFVTEKFVQEAGLQRKRNQLYSLGVKEVIKVSHKQYLEFTQVRAVHALGYPLWRPVAGPAIFGGGVMYPAGDNKIAVGMIAALDWKNFDFNPQEALDKFKKHEYAAKYVSGGKVIEAGAKMIPEGGIDAVVREMKHGWVGLGNTIVLGDSAGFVNMIKIKGIHNAIESGIAAGDAIRACINHKTQLAEQYTKRLSDVFSELEAAKNFRQTICKFGPLMGLPLAAFGKLLPGWKIEPDYKMMSEKSYRYKSAYEFDKSNFTFLAGTKHREDQPNHLEICDPEICKCQCIPNYAAPCVTFCPAGVYEKADGKAKAVNPSNCLHCKTCQRKCPFDNIKWHMPEGGGGPSYSGM